MDFKFIMVSVLLISSVWALSVSGLISVKELDAINLTSELSTQAADGGFESPLANQFNSMVSVLSLAIPAGFIALVMLVITYGHNPIGVLGMALSIALFAFSYNNTMDAVTKIEANSNYSLNARVWWK